MKMLDLTIRFTTPAFLGNAEQSGQWRTPPFKALLRQWWRVVYAAEKQFSIDIEAMCREEGLLFGDAGLDDDRRGEGSSAKPGKSKIRIRLDNKWGTGKLFRAPDIGRIWVGKNQIPGALYSGYGPVKPGPKLKGKGAINSGEGTLLRVAFPEDYCLEIEQAFALINEYGTVGGRSRNGWGSFELKGKLPAPNPVFRNWKDAMELDWPHALGKDERGELVWRSASQPKWQEAMQLLAQTRSDVRRAVPERLMLAYPDTRGILPGWGRDARVPNSLRFKVIADEKRYVALIFHMPCRPAVKLWEKLSKSQQQDLLDCFSKAHCFLDEHPKFYRRESNCD